MHNLGRNSYVLMNFLLPEVRKAKFYLDVEWVFQTTYQNVLECDRSLDP